LSRLASTFERTRTEGRAAFVSFLVAGDPDLATSEELIVALESGGSDVIELGVPFSDPIADGPVNQRAAQRALAAGTTLDGILALVGRVRSRVAAPLVLFTYFNPIHSRGVERFARQAAAVGVDGVLCVDLPPEEGADLRRALGRHGIDSVLLLSPTSTPQRIRLASGAASGFVYYVSRAGVTGEQAQLAQDLEAEVRRVKRRVGLPVAVGFGISTAAQVAAVGSWADGVVVGSALVRTVETALQGGDVGRLAARLRAKVRELSAPLKRGVGKGKR
jgi:tryptophan synthase alpha chain